jgi:hypothetical protein
LLAVTAGEDELAASASSVDGTLAATGLAEAAAEDGVALL